jgi:hypothetical protein
MLCLAGLAAVSAEDDGPPVFVPPSADYGDPLLMPTNPPPLASATANSQPHFPWEGEPLWPLQSRSKHEQKAIPLLDK